MEQIKYHSDNKSEGIIIVNIGERFDLRVATSLLNKIGLFTTGISGKLHVPSYQFHGPGSNLFYESEERPGRLYDHLTFIE